MVRCADGWPGLAVVDRPGGAGRGGEGGLDDGVAPAVKGIVVRRIAATRAIAEDGAAEGGANQGAQGAAWAAPRAHQPARWRLPRRPGRL